MTDLFKGSDKLFDLIETNHHLLPVINRFGIRPGFKDKTVADVCKEKNINEDFFLALINTYNNPEYFPETQLLGFSPMLIVEYLKKTHEYFIGYFIPRLESMLDRLIGSGQENKKELKMIMSFYNKYKKELLLHIQDEEEHVFPFVKQFVDSGKTLSRSSLISSKQHTDVEMELSDLKSLMLKYLEPDYKNEDFNELMAMIYDFEKDITDHARIEDYILFPKIMNVETSQ